ncbi:hypothetical protein O181_001398 [Austropuccinia psidii MF-1]|uniref:Uncharacterized protein n=1 Tax=Austropuccinia psidii MF-1 TaxID=1389203 RepID=A0A9Q3BAP6_9BASI|nr:hypothetical protein [Austropuccinia psidii MF-1]
MTSHLLNSLPSISALVSSIPSGKDPYTYGLNLLESSAFPPVEPKTFRILIFMSFIHACTIIASGMFIILTFLRTRDKRNKGWIARRFYVKGSPNTYWIPNTSLAVAVCQLLTSCFCEVYTYVDYASLKSPEFAGKISIAVCVQFMWLFNFYSYVVTSWGALSTCLSAPDPSLVLGKIVLNRPGILYVISALVPVFVTSIVIGWSIVLGQAYHKVIQNVQNVRNLLLASSQVWNAGLLPPPRDFFNILDASGVLLEATGKLITWLRWNSFIWAILWTLTATTYICSVWPLVKMIKTCSERIVQMKTSSQSSEDSNFPSLPQTVPNDENQSKNVCIALRRSYIFLMCHCSVMTVSILYTFSVCIVIGIHADQVILMSQWRSLGAWLYLVSGVFSAIAMLSQAWRSCSDFEFTTPSTVSDLRTLRVKNSECQNGPWNSLTSRSEFSSDAHEDNIDIYEEILIISTANILDSEKKVMGHNLEILRE